MKTIVVSAVNLKVGGTLTILRDCLEHLVDLAATGKYKIVALVYDKNLAFYPYINYIEMKWPKKTWANRLWCEYVTMYHISRQLSPVYLWLSLHDTTPYVKAKKRAVYCHNSFPFYHWRMREILFTPKIVLFSLFSKYAYQINIRQNNYVIVQQQWLREAFAQWFSLSEESIIVAPPTPPQQPAVLAMSQEQTRPTDYYTFIYPAAPDSHKNFECICKAAQLLHRHNPSLKFKVAITIKGNENSYTRWLYRLYGSNVPALDFIGYLSKKKIYEYYQQSDCMIFPSKVETWGLPITEFAAYGKPMLLSDLPYAHETASGCTKVSFFNPDSPEELASKMKRLIEKDETFLISPKKQNLSSPVAKSWRELFDILLSNN